MTVVEQEVGIDWKALEPKRFGKACPDPCKHCGTNHKCVSVDCGIILFAYQGDDLGDFLDFYGWGTAVELTEDDEPMVYWRERMKRP